MSKKIFDDLLDRLTFDGRRGRLDRREFIRHAVAAGMTVAAASSLWMRET